MGSPLRFHENIRNARIVYEVEKSTCSKLKFTQKRKIVKALRLRAGNNFHVFIKLINKLVLRWIVWVT